MASDDRFVVNEKDMGINVTGKNGMDYVEKASFSIELCKHIDAGDDSGFVCKIFCSLKDELRYIFLNVFRSILRLIKYIKSNYILIPKLAHIFSYAIEYKAGP
jgi:hypothetical protein